MKLYYLHLALFVVIVLQIDQLSAQGKTSTIAKGGSHGIYIGLGMEPVSKKYPLKGITAYRVERRKSKEAKWKLIADIEGPVSFVEFQERFTRSLQYLPQIQTFYGLHLPSIWSKFEETWKIDSIGISRTFLPVQVALGIVYFDTTAQRGVSYVYRVSNVLSTGKAKPAFSSTPVSFPQTPKFARMRLLSQKYFGKKVNVEWTFGSGQRPVTFQVFRQDNMLGKFIPIQPLMGTTRSKEGTNFVVEDSLVAQGHLYKYYLIPMDYVGNKGASTDTVTVAAYDFSTAPLPEKIYTQSLDSIGGIRLAWHLDRPMNLKSLRIFRSSDYDSGYVQIAEVPPSDTAYFDQSVRPMIKYFYYLTMTSPLGQVSPRSVRVFGMYKSRFHSLSPQIIKWEGIKNGVRLKWISREQLIDGYYVYRSSGSSRKLEQILTFIPKKDSVTIFIDTSKTLSGRFQYAYSVRSENTSHLLSGYSDTVYVRPLIPVEISAPVKIEASDENGSVQLYWEDAQSIEQTVKGYEIYRREVVPSSNSQKKFQKITDTLLAPSHNRYIDTKVVEGKTYEYAVKAFDWFGNASALSASAILKLKLTRPVPPAGLRAVKMKDGISIQWNETFQPDIAGFNVYCYQRGKKPKLLGTVKSDQLQYIDKTARAGYLYFYYVTCLNSKKFESKPSTEVGIRR